MANPAERYNREEEAEDDEEEALDETVRSTDFHSIECALTASEGLQDRQRRGALRHRREPLDAEEAAALRLEESRPRFAHICRPQMRLPAHAAAHHLAPQ